MCKSKIINMVQMSGFGKTQYAMQHTQKNGGIVVRFVAGVHLNMLDIAAAVLDYEYMMNPVLHAHVLDYQSELSWTKYGKQVMELIPLTFIQYAEAFYAAANSLNLSEEDKRIAFQRALTNRASNFIHEMYKTDLHNHPFRHNYLESEETYSRFRERMLQSAKQLNLTAFYYDEIHQLDSVMKGKFMHISSEATKEQCLRRLKKERHGDFESDDVFKRATSLLYCFILSIEDIIRQFQIPQVVMTTKYSAALMVCAEDPTGRDRLKVEDFIINQDITESVKRFKKLAAEAFGPNIQPLLEPHEDTLKKLASRADYLFGSFPAMVRDTMSGTLKDLVDKYFRTAVHRAQEIADSHVKKALKDKSKEIAAVFLRVALGADSVELMSLTAQKLVARGPMLLSSTFADREQSTEMQSVKVAEAFDPFIRENISQLSIDTLMRMVERIDPASQLTIGTGELGEFAANLVTKIFAAKSLRLSMLASNISLDKTIAAAHKLNAKLHLFQGDITGEQDFFENMQKYEDKLLKPSSLCHPDGVAIVKDTRTTDAVGYFLMQVKNWNGSLNRATLQTALKSLNPRYFYANVPKQNEPPICGNDKLQAHFDKWQTLFPKLKDRVWIRVVFARGFTADTTIAVQKYNQTATGKQYPIILVTTALLPLKLQLLDMKPKRIKRSNVDASPFDSSNLEAEFGLKF